MSQPNDTLALSALIAQANDIKPTDAPATETLYQPHKMRVPDTTALDPFFNSITVDEGTTEPQPNPNVRTIQRKTRLTVAEDALFLARVEKSGKTQSAFLREAALHHEIHSLQLPDKAERACDALLENGSHIKKASGWLTQALLYNKQFAPMTSEKINSINQLIDRMKEIGDEMVRKGDELHGYLQAYRGA